MFSRCLILILTVMFLLSACNSPVYMQSEDNVADVVLKTAAKRKQFDMMGRTSPSLVVKKGLYVDQTPISLARSPTWLNNRIVIRGDQLPFSYYSRTIALGANSNVLTKFQVGLDPAINVSLNYSGTIRGALDLLATKTGYVYSVKNNLVYWQAFVTRTFDIAFMPGGTDYLMGKASSGGTTTGGGAQVVGSGGTVANYVSSDSSDNEYSNLKGTLSIWKDLDGTIRQLLSPEGKVMVSESTTSVTVRDRPSNVELISQYIANLNKSLSRQVLVKVQILEVLLQNDWNFGIDWQIIARAFNKSPFVVNANYGTPISITSLSPQGTNFAGAALTTPQFGVDQSQNPASAGGAGGLPSYTILVQALSQQGKTSVVSEPRVLCLNNQVSVVRVVTSEGYVASIQNTTLGNTSTTSVNNNTVTSQVTPGSIVTGLTLYILPKIMKDKIYLQVNADMSTNNGFTIFGAANLSSTTNAVQLPNITIKHFNQRSMLKSGEMLILSGFRQVTNRANAMQWLNMQSLGGKGSTQLNRETIVLITPIVLDGGVA